MKSAQFYAGNVAYTISETDLPHVFAAGGSVIEVKIRIDRQSGRARGFAFFQCYE